MDSLTIEHQRTAHSVDIWQAIKGHHVSNDGAHHIRDRRAAVYFDNGFVGDDFVDRRCLRRIGSRGLHAARGRAGSRAIIALAPAAARLSFSINGRPLLIQNIPCSPSGGLPSTARIYLPLYCVMMSSRLLPHGFQRQPSKYRRNRGKSGKDDVLRQWVSGADKRFGTAGAFQTVDPYHRNARFVLQRPCNLLVPFPRLIPATWQPDYNI